MKTLGVTFWYALLSIGFVGIVVAEVVFFMNQNTSLSEKESKLSADNSVLVGRLDALEKVSSVVIQAAGQTTDALPSENPALLVTSQIRQFAQNHSLVVKNLNLSSTPVKEGDTLGSVQASFTISGVQTDILSFTKDILSAAPLLKLDTLNYSSNTIGGIAQFQVNAFWSGLPTKLPSLAQPLTALSPEETQILADLATLQKPVFQLNSQGATESGTPKEDPFSK